MSRKLLHCRREAYPDDANSYSQSSFRRSSVNLWKSRLTNCRPSDLAIFSQIFSGDLIYLTLQHHKTAFGTMSFQTYDSFQAQQGQPDAGGAGPGVPQQQDSAMGGQNPDNSPAGFQGGNVGEPGSAGGQPGGDAKTTLWYVGILAESFRCRWTHRVHIGRHSIYTTTLIPISFTTDLT